MPEPTYKEKNYSLTRGVVSKAYANAPRKAARSAEVADDGAKTARQEQVRDTNTELRTTRSSGRVIKPSEGLDSGKVIDPTKPDLKSAVGRFIRKKMGVSV